jgi:hypothetical protein
MKISYTVDAIQYDGENADEVANFIGRDLHMRFDQYEAGTWFWETNTHEGFSYSDPDEGEVKVVVDHSFGNIGNLIMSGLNPLSLERNRNELHKIPIK